MSFDSILARSPSIIYKPGGVAAGLIVTTWAQVQKYIAARQGTVIVYVDDSIVSPALIPGATGITDCEGRVEFRPFALDAILYTVLQIEDGATLANLMCVNGMELRCNCESVTPSLSWSDTVNGPFLEFQNLAILSNAATATNPAIVVPVGKTWALFGGEGGFIIQLNAPAVPLVSLPTASSALNVTAYADSEIPSGFLSGIGIFTLVYDNTTANEFPHPFVVPPQPAFTGTTLPLSFGSTPRAVGSIIYQPGGTSSGDIVATWPEVQSLIQAYTFNTPQGSTGKFIVYIDDSIVTPAHVPAATGVTDCFGRVEFRPFKQDLINYKILQVDNGATLKNIYRIAGTLAIEGDTTGATPAFDWDFPAAAPGPCLYIDEFAFLTTTGTATQPACRITTGVLNILATGQGGISQGSATAIFSVTAPGSLQMFLNDGSLDTLNTSWATGTGTVFVEYDSSSVAISGNGAVQPSAAATNIFFQLDSHVVTMIFLASTTNVLAALQATRPLLPTFGMFHIDVEGFGGTGGAGGGQGGGAAPGAGGGASGGCNNTVGSFDFDLSHRLDVTIGVGGIGGLAGAAGGGAGGDGGDGAPSFALDFTTSVNLASFAGSGHGAGGPTSLGGGNFPGNPLAFGQGFPAAGGSGGVFAAAGTSGNQSYASFNFPTGGTNVWSGGTGGASAVAQGGGGGGGGAGPFANGAGGGASTATSGNPGTASTVNDGNGAGGGAGGTTVGGGAGGAGAAGRLKLTFVAF